MLIILRIISKYKIGKAYWGVFTVIPVHQAVAK